MPRLILRLAKFLQDDAAGKIIYRQRQPKPKLKTRLNVKAKQTLQIQTTSSPYEPSAFSENAKEMERTKGVQKASNCAVSQRPSFVRPTARKRSFLMDANPVMDKKRYMPPRDLKPVLPSQQEMKSSIGRRVMNNIELDMMASPYARMLSSPIRTCVLTKAMQPRDLLISLGAAYDRSTKQKYLLPNGMENPKYKRREDGKGYWICCWKEAMHEFLTNPSRTSHFDGAIPHRLLLQQVEELLRKRFLQELKLLEKNLRLSKTRVASEDTTILRRLTRREWIQIGSMEMITIPGAVAILHFPNTDNPKDESSVNISDTTDGQNAFNPPEAYPVFRMIPGFSLKTPETAETLETSASSKDWFPSPNTLCSVKVPVYNMAALFPHEGERKRVTRIIYQVLRHDYGARCRWWSLNPDQKPKDSQDPLDKLSGAYLLRSTASTLSRADAVPLCIALWRLRLWAGEDWSDSLWGRWEALETSKDATVLKVIEATDNPVTPGFSKD